MTDKPHIPSADCWCKPKVTQVQGGQNIVHRATKEPVAK